MTSKICFQSITSSLLAGLLVACGSLSGNSISPTISQSDQAQASNPKASPSLATPAQLTASASQLERIDRIVAETLVEDGPGVAVLVLRNNQIVHAKGYGFANVKKQSPITAETNFDLASVSKQVTAMCILKLVQAGQVKLDAPVQQYVPEFQDRSKSITIAQLLHHTSGLADYSSQDWDGTDEEFSQLDLEQHLEWLNQQQPRRPPGKKFEYNNSGYALLALVVQRVAQKPFWQFAQDEIFSPLGMSQTQILHRLGQNIPNTALGYLVKDGEIQRSQLPSVIQGDGNVFSSIADLAKYDIALRTGRLIPDTLKAIAFSSGQLDNGRAIQSEGEGYGLGWYITPNYVHHSGSWQGTSTYYRHYLKEPITIIVLANDENYGSNDLADQIAEYLKL